MELDHLIFDAVFDSGKLDEILKTFNFSRSKIHNIFDKWQAFLESKWGNERGKKSLFKHFNLFFKMLIVIKAGKNLDTFHLFLEPAALVFNSLFLNLWKFLASDATIFTFDNKSRNSQWKIYTVKKLFLIIFRKLSTPKMSFLKCPIALSVIPKKTDSILAESITYMD